MLSIRGFAFVFLLTLLLPYALALDAPAVTSPSHPSGEWGAFPMEFRWNEVEGAKEYCYALTANTDVPEELSICTGNTDAYPPKKIQSGDYYFHVKTVSLGGESAVTTYAIKLDVDGPAGVVLSGETTAEGGTEISWEASEDDASGVKEYEIYRSGFANFDIRDLVATKIATVLVPATAFSDSNATDQSRTYHYKIRPVDKVGNPGPVSNEVHITTAAKCDLDIDFSVVLSESKEELELGIVSNDKIYNGFLTVALPDGTERGFFSDSSPFFDWSGSLDLSGVEQGYIDFSLGAEEMFGDDCSQEKRFVYDIVNPTVSFISPKYNTKVSETVPFEAKVVDSGPFKGGIDSVTFFLKNGVNWQQIGSGTEEGNEMYSFDWDSFSAENGQQKIKVEVIDSAGNSAEAVQTLSVLNAFDGEVDLNAALEQTLNTKLNAFASRDELAASAISSEKVLDLISQADSNLSDAKRLAALDGIGNETSAKMLFATAILLYNQSMEIVETSPYNTSDFIFNKEQSGILFNAAGLSGPALDQAKLFTEKYEPTRQLQIISVTDDNSTYYKAIVKVSFSLDVNILADHNSNDFVLKIVEFIPKEFAEYAVELDSNLSFVVLNDDPVISFILTREQYRMRTLSYVLKENLTKEQADAMVSEGIINKFAAPPALMLPETTVSGLGFSLDFIIFAVISVILVVIAILAIFLLRKRFGKKHSSKQQAFASKPEPKPQKSKEKKGIFSNIKKPGFGKKDESPLSVFGKK